MKTLIQWCEQREALFGRATLAASIVMAVIGFPLQIAKTISEQHCGLHRLMIVLALIYAVRIPYSIGKRAWALIPADVIGFLSCAVLLMLCYHYSTKGP